MYALLSSRERRGTVVEGAAFLHMAIIQPLTFGDTPAHFLGEFSTDNYAPFSGFLIGLERLCDHLIENILQHANPIFHI